MPTVNSVSSSLSVTSEASRGSSVKVSVLFTFGKKELLSLCLVFSIGAESSSRGPKGPVSLPFAPYQSRA